MLEKNVIDGPGQGKTLGESLIPNFSHRCAAVAAGIARVGWS